MYCIINKGIKNHCLGEGGTAPTSPRVPPLVNRELHIHARQSLWDTRAAWHVDVATLYLSLVICALVSLLIVAVKYKTIG